MSYRNKLPDFSDERNGAKRLFENLPKIFGRSYVAFIEENFDREGFAGGAKWPNRKRESRFGNRSDKGQRGLLVKSGRLKNSWQDEVFGGNQVRIYTAVQYAKAHNEGFNGKVNQRVRTHTRTRNGRKETVRAHSRTIDQNIPQRQMVGPSKVFDDEMGRYIEQQLDKLFS